MSYNTALIPEIERYLDIVEKEEFRTCEQQKKLAAYVRRVFETETLTVDTERVRKYLS